MNYRDATVTDIPQLQIIRNNVKENVLSDPSLVTYNDYLQYLTRRGKGWVCEIDNRIVGFAIVDKIGNNIWALFVNSDFEKRGIGKKLLELMLAWYFNETTNTVWLTTASKYKSCIIL